MMLTTHPLKLLAEFWSAPFATCLAIVIRNRNTLLNGLNRNYVKQKLLRFTFIKNLLHASHSQSITAAQVHTFSVGKFKPAAGTKGN
jgi:hypothetical protein